MIQSPDLFPMPNMSDVNAGDTDGYLRLALRQAKKTTEAFLSSIRELTTTHTQSYMNQGHAPIGSYILAHPKKDTSTQNTNFVVSLSDPSAYAMLATLADPSKVPLSTSTTTRGQIRQQITTLNLTTYTRSIIGRTYSQLLTDSNITQLNTNLPPLRYNQTKGLTCRPNDKMAREAIMLAHTDVLQAYEKGLHEQELEEPPPAQTNKQSLYPPNLPKNTHDNLPQGKGKDKMPPMKWQLPEPLKYMRQKQAADAKLLAAHAGQREGICKEQENIRTTEATEKQATANRLKTPPPSAGTIAKDTLPDPS